MAFAGYITELLPKDEGMVFRLKNSGQKIFLFCLILLAGSCQATPDGAMKNFNTLPLDNNTLVAMNLRENLGNECHSIIVTALFYNPEPFENVLNDIEIALVNEGWQEDDWYYRKTKNGMLPQQLWRMYEQGKRASVSINANTRYKSINLREDAVDVTALSLLENKPIDNEIEDGYFVVDFYYHPFYPNQCKG